MKYEPAFPLPENYSDSGMSLRDYFAAKAMQCILNNRHIYVPLIRKIQESDIMQNKELIPADIIKLDVSELSYKYADAMLKQREK